MLRHTHRPHRRQDETREGTKEKKRRKKMFCPIMKKECKEHECEWFMVSDKDEEACAVTVIAMEIGKRRANDDN